MLDSVSRRGFMDVDPYGIPLQKIDVRQADHYQRHARRGFFERRRREDPVRHGRDGGANEHGRLRRGGFDHF
ncbi:hypothetical protein [Immundisolibacter cernigliae]|uniref:Uncharacterized protein n=1 Tax=Immundisolibacter cernigliae TaxID=1810504 RepID=A0A1B1YVP0_9GAMM|nr:hypothetical protein [Immundisolibacter cernigliae]ANX04836.1 hypothetical protein PG2T_12105 [Immundisolibacter cernigliae]